MAEQGYNQGCEILYLNIFFQKNKYIVFIVLQCFRKTIDCEIFYWAEKHSFTTLPQHLQKVRQHLLKSYWLRQTAVVIMHSEQLSEFLPNSLSLLVRLKCILNEILFLF